MDRIVANSSDILIKNPRCVACFPGYKPTFAVVSESTKIENSSYITTCTPIENCDIKYSNTFNRCDWCKGVNSLALNSELEQKSDGLECVRSGISNCLIYD